MQPGVRVKTRGSDYDNSWPVPSGSRRRGLQAHVTCEEAVPGVLGDHPDGVPIVGIGTNEAVLDEEFPPLQVGQKPPSKGLEPLGLHGLVDFAPPDTARAGRLAHDEPIIGRAAGVVPRADHQRAHVGDGALPPTHRLLIDGGRRQVPVGGEDVLDTVHPQATVGLHFWHRRSPLQPEHASPDDASMVTEGTQVEKPRLLTIRPRCWHGSPAGISPSFQASRPGFDSRLPLQTALNGTTHAWRGLPKGGLRQPELA